MMDKRKTVEIDLDFPIEVDGREVDKVTMRRPKVDDELTFSEAKGSQARKAVVLLAALCELTPKQVGSMDTADFAKLEKQYADFRGSQPASSDGP